MKLHLRQCSSSAATLSAIATAVIVLLFLPSHCSAAWWFDVERIWPQKQQRVLQEEEQLPSQQTNPIILADLTKDYERAVGEPHPLHEEMTQIASAEPDVNGYLALECGKIVSEYYDQNLDETTLFQMFSVTKAWSGLMIGAAVREGLIDVDETLLDIWPDPAVWENVPNATLRQQITVKQVLQMRGGFVMPE